jgi:hypothetical protein
LQSRTDSLRSLRNQCESPLLRLPGEIKNQVYEYALGGKTWTIWRGQDDVCNKRKDALALLRVCRQLHADTAALPFKLSIFAHNGDPFAFQRWLRRKAPPIARTTMMSMRLNAPLTILSFKPGNGISRDLRIYRYGISFEHLPSLKYLQLNCFLASPKAQDGQFNFKGLVEGLRQIFEEVKAFNPGVSVIMKVSHLGSERVWVLN